MDFVNDVDLVFPQTDGNAPFDDFPYIIDAVVGSGVDFNNIHGVSCRDGLAGRRAFIAGAAVWMLAINGLCQNFVAKEVFFLFPLYRKKDRRA